MPVTAHSSLVVQVEGEEGYYVVGRANQISGFGYVDTGIDKVAGQKLGHPIVGAAVDPGGVGLLTVSSNGAVFTFGEAPNYGSALGKKLHAPIVGIAAHTTSLPSAKGSLIDGYWLVSSAGAIFTYGKAHYYGSVGGHLQTPIVGMALTSDEAGYWLATGGGGVLSYGDARNLGSMGGKHLRAPSLR